MQTSFEKPIVIAKQDWRMTIVGLVLALGFFSLPFGTWINSSASLGRSLAYELIIWSWIIVMLLYVVRVERRPLRSIGFRARAWSTTRI